MVGKPRTAPCGLCRHPERAHIEGLHVAGASYRVLGRRFGLSKDVIFHHFKVHVSPQRKAELTAGPAKVADLANAAAAESKSLLDYLGITRSVLFNQFLSAAEAGDRAGVAHIAGRLLDSLRELADLTGELRKAASGISVTNNVLNVFASPEFTALSEGLLGIARQHPAARADIVALLRGLDARPATPARPNSVERPMMIEAEALNVV